MHRWAREPAPRTGPALASPDLPNTSPHLAPPPRAGARSLWEFGIPIGLRGGLKARDPEFADKVRAAFPDTSTHLMLLDIAGGSLEEPPVPEFATGQGYDFTKSQALQCAYELVQAGYTNLSYVRGGCNDWFEDAHNDAEGVLPKGEGKGPWLGHSEVYAYRQFRMKDPTKGRRTF